MAVAVRKGGEWHRRSGMVFVYTMTLTGMTAVGIATYEGKPGNLAGAVMAYFVITAYLTVRPLAGIGRWVNVSFMFLAAIFSIGGFITGFTALDMPGNQLDGAPAGMLFFLATINGLAAIGDARMIRAGGIQGSRRVARHLWRMCFGLFIASGSFFIGQMKFIPEPIRNVPLLIIIGVSPLLVLLYWMWRVRLRQNLRGLVTVTPAPTLSPVTNKTT